MENQPILEKNIQTIIYFQYQYTRITREIHHHERVEKAER